MKKIKTLKKVMKKVIVILTFCLVLAFPFTSLAAPGGLHKPRRTYEEAVKHYQELQNKQINIDFSHRGLYIAENSILYARKIVGVNKDGTYQLSPWECISNRTNVCYCQDKHITLPATYIIFGYSFDVNMGTDWPFSQEFWNNANTPAENIQIVITGGCRTPEILIMVNGNRVYFNDNCEAHNQWIPR